jgi:Predicted nucleic acid-binding protein, contains PIN domain
MINKYLLDTNILIYYFNDGSEVQPIFDEIEVGDAEAFYCPISWVELLCYPALTEEEANEMREFLRLLNCVSLTESVLALPPQLDLSHQQQSNQFQKTVHPYFQKYPESYFASSSTFI